MVDYYPLVTFFVTLALALLLGRQFAQRHKRHQLVWTVSLGLLALAALIAFLGNHDIVGWSVAVYKAYLPLTAIPVGLIGLGVLLLFAKHPRWSQAYAAYWVITAALVLAVVAITPVKDPNALGQSLAEQGPNVGGSFLPGFGSVSLLQTLPGAAVFIGGGVYSWWKDRTRKYGLILGAGGVLFTVAGATSRLGGSAVFFLLTTLAAIVTFIGFVLAVEFSAVRAASPAKA